MHTGQWVSGIISERRATGLRIARRESEDGDGEAAGRGEPEAEAAYEAALDGAANGDGERARLREETHFALEVHVDLRAQHGALQVDKQRTCRRAQVN